MGQTPAGSDPELRAELVPEQFQAAVRINPEDANAEANLGSAFAEIGDIKQAKLHYERALRLNPNNELARENLQLLGQTPRNSPK